MSTDDPPLPIPAFSVAAAEAVADDAAARTFLTEMLWDRDIPAWVNADWSAVADDFDAEAFVGYVSGPEGGPWSIICPTLADYERLWVAEGLEAAATASRESLAADLRTATWVDSIEIKGDRALMRKRFDGTVAGTPLARTSYYLLRRDPDRWRITGFCALLGAGDKDYAR